jgi:hypothetical protein
VQEAASHADPRTTMRYDRARVSLDATPHGREPHRGQRTRCCRGVTCLARSTRCVLRVVRRRVQRLRDTRVVRWLNRPGAGIMRA